MDIQIDLIDADLSSVRQDRVDAIIDSIEDIGLLHPLTVSKNGDRFRLIAGRVRLRACQILNIAAIPCNVVEGESSIQNEMEISLQENLRRSNLEWYEQIELEEQLHNLRIAQHGKRRTGRNASKESGWSQQDTAAELKIALGAMSQDLFLANAIKRNPHLKNVKDKQTALKLAKESARREFQESESLIPADFEMNQILCGDSAEVLKELPSDTFNFCLTDPPWLDYKDEKLTRDESTLPVFQEIFRVLKRDSLLYAFVSTPDFYFYSQELPKFGFLVQEYPMIWHKSERVSYGSRAWETFRDFEPILVAAKGSPVFSTNQKYGSVLKYESIPSMKLVHPHEKPLDMLKELIRRTTFDGGKVLDPFAGSGSTLIAAKEMKRDFLGIERDFRFYEKIQKRIESWVTQSLSASSE